MSGRIDPKQSAVNAQPGLLERWADAVYEGRQIERLSPQAYCDWSWARQYGTHPSKATYEFMNSCIRECTFQKTFSNWHQSSLS